jgi:hypothetical protein
MVLQNMKTVIKIILLFFLANSINCFSQSKIDRSKRISVRREPITIIKIMKGTQILQVMFHSITNLEIFSFKDLCILLIIYCNYDIENHLHNNLSNYPYDSNLSGNFENSDSVSPTINYLKARLRESTSFKSQQFIWKSFKSKFVLHIIL